MASGRDQMRGGGVGTVLQTERLILRPWTASDTGDLFRYARDPEIGPAAGWPPHKSPEESLNIIESVFSSPECYAVCLQSDNRAIGAAELKLPGRASLTAAEGECELGYWIGRPFWGRGYIPEAAAALVRRGFAELGMDAIWCGYYEGNHQSRRVQEKLGFRFHHTEEDCEVPLLGVRRTVHVNLLTRTDWEELASVRR